MKNDDNIWMDRIQKCRESGLSDSVWCKENGIAVSTFYYHARKLRERACNVPAPAEKTRQEMHEVVPVEWNISEAATESDIQTISRQDSAALKISASGMMLEIQNDISDRLLRAVFQALQESC